MHLTAAPAFGAGEPLAGQPDSGRNLYRPQLLCHFSAQRLVTGVQHASIGDCTMLVLRSRCAMLNALCPQHLQTAAPRTVCRT